MIQVVIDFYAGMAEAFNAEIAALVEEQREFDERGGCFVYEECVMPSDEEWVDMREELGFVIFL